MTFKEITASQSNILDLAQFKEMDYYAVENYALPIELMMENAGLQLANLVADTATNFDTKILIGIGNGNNGGGGLVAARRLAAWGYDVYLDLSTDINKDLPKSQLERAIKFGAKKEAVQQPDIWVDAYLGFSQKLPLSVEFSNRIIDANNSKAIKIALDIPTGFIGEANENFFKADKILTLAALKKILYTLDDRTEIYIGDIGIPFDTKEV